MNQKEPTKKRFQVVLKRLIDKKGLSHNEIERRSNKQIYHAFIGKILSGTAANPRLDKLLALSEFFDVSISELVGEQREPGFSQSQFYKLYETYTGIEDELSRKTIDFHIANLVALIDTVKKRKK